LPKRQKQRVFTTLCAHFARSKNLHLRTFAETPLQNTKLPISNPTDGNFYQLYPALPHPNKIHTSHKTAERRDILKNWLRQNN
jgi:hypothetical protein